MRSYNKLMKLTAAVLILAFTSTSSYAQLMSVKQLESISYEKNNSLKTKILEKIEQEEAQEQIAKLGISPEEAKLRIAALSEREIRSIANGENNQAGGEVVVIGLSTLLIIIIILLLID